MDKEKIEITKQLKREEIIAQKKQEGKQLIEEQNLIEGHFLIFETTPETLEELIERKIKELVSKSALKEQPKQEE